MALPPGRLLDLGCGTGINCLTLARLGWNVVGVDFAGRALEKANQKAWKVMDEVVGAGGSVHFLQTDVTRLAPPVPANQFSLVLDIGCLNSISPAPREVYARMVARQAMPGALFLLYAHFPSIRQNGPIGCLPEELDQLFVPAFQLERRTFGVAPQGGQSMWNWLRRIF
jgi:SAM-dependent methyltransferase